MAVPEYLERSIPYFPLRFMIHAALIVVSASLIVPLAVWLGGGNPWLTGGVYAALWGVTIPVRLFLISFIVVLVAQSIEAQQRKPRP